MGNKNSVEKSDTPDAGAKDPPVADAPASTAVVSPRARSGSTSRRIIKASKPVGVVVTVQSDEESTKEKKNGDDDLDEGKKKSPHVPFKIADSPQVARELEQEKVEKLKKEAFDSAQNRRRATREKEMKERRKNPDHRRSDVKANPMSRFLSVFSVETKHPEHKRAYEASTSDKEESGEPSEKKMRSLDSKEVFEAKDKLSDETSSSPWSSRTIVASAVAVAAIAVAAALRWNRFKV